MLIVAQKQVLGTELAMGDIRGNGFRHGEYRGVLIGLEDDAFLIEQLQGFRFSVHGAFPRIVPWNHERPEMHRAC